MAALLRRFQEKRVESAVDKWWGNSNSISVFVSGKTGTGKSTLVNALLGEKVAKQGDTLDPETSEVQSFKGNIQGIDVTVWDSPGLQDGTKNESKYLKDIKKKCNGKIDLLLYCISLNTTRFLEGTHDMESMNKLTKTLGPEIWENAVVVLTQANTEIASMADMIDHHESVEEKFNERLIQWKSAIMQHIKDKVELSAEVAENVQILPAGRIELPFLFNDHRPWLSHLWLESFVATKTRAQPALIKMNFYRLIRSSDVKKEDDIEDLLRSQKIIIHDKAIDVGKKTWFVNPERAEDVGQVVSRKKSKALILLNKILPDLGDQLPEGVVSALDKFLNDLPS